MNGVKHVPRVGDFVKPDSWDIGERLLQSDWDKCEFRLPADWDGKERTHKLAVNIKVTGKKCLIKGYSPDVVFRSRCRIEFVGDGESSTHIGGYIYH